MSRYALFQDRSTGVFRDLLAGGGEPPQDLQPSEVPRLLRALDVQVKRASRESCRALRAQSRELRRVTSTLPPPPPPPPTLSAAES